VVRWVGDDVVPTSLNEGRGEMVAPALVVVLHLGLKYHLLDGWASGGASGKTSMQNFAKFM